MIRLLPLPPLRARPAAAAVVVGLLLTALAGCGSAGATPAATPAAPPAATPAAVPAAPPAGACFLLDRAVIAEHLGLELEVAAARSRGATHSCVRRVEAAPEPELVLTVTPTTVDVPTFVQDVTPPGATAISRLGKAGYQGPGLHIGWLSGDDRLLTLTLRLPEQADPDRYADGLLELARSIDRARN